MNPRKIPLITRTRESQEMKSSIAAVVAPFFSFAAAPVALANENALSPTDKGTLVTNEPPAEIMALIKSHIDGFNTQNNELFLSVFGDTAIVIDGIAPYRWMNPDGPAKWLADVEKWRKDLGVTHEQLDYKLSFWNVEGSAAYAVIDGTLKVTMKGQTVVRKGTLAYTLANRGGVWKIEAQAWGRTA